MLVVGAVVAPAPAQAAAAPFWSVGGTRLAAGVTHNIAAKGYKEKGFTISFQLGVGELVKVTCAALTAEKAVLLGSSKGEPGRDGGSIKFSGCALEEGNGYPKCEIEPTITTRLGSELVENVVSGEGGKQLLEEFFPETGSKFMTLKFKPQTSCTVAEIGITGKAVGEVLTDPGEEKIELGQTAKEAASWLLKFPAAPIHTVWLIANEVGKEASTELVAFAETVFLAGTVLTSLANSKFEPEETKWSPLP